MAIHIIGVMPAGADTGPPTTAQEFRQMLNALTSLYGGISGQQGVVGNTTAGSLSLAVSQRGAGANLSVDVATGRAFIIGDDITTQGLYSLWSDSVVNVPGITVPGSGTYHHRIEFQVQDKLALGSYSGYVGAIIAKLDGGGGLPAEDNSAITLATIDIPTGSASVTNAMINDYRQKIGPYLATKAGSTGRTTTPMTDDPDIQLLNLQANAIYEIDAQLFYSGNATGDLNTTWRCSSGCIFNYQRKATNPSGGTADDTMWVATDTVGYGNGSGGLIQGGRVWGRLTTGAAPAFAVLQWGQRVASGTTTLQPRTWARANLIG